MTSVLLTVSTGLEAQRREPDWVKVLPDNEQFVVADKRGVMYLMSIPELEVVREFVGVPEERIEAVTLSPDGRWLATHYGKDQLWVFDVTTGDPVHQLQHRDLRAGNMVFLPEQNQIVALARDRVFRWSLDSGELLEEPTRLRDDLPAASSDGLYAATINRNIELKIYDFPSLEELTKIRVQRLDEFEDYRRGWDWSASGLTFTDDNDILLVVNVVEERELGDRPFGALDDRERRGWFVLISPEDPDYVEIREYLPSEGSSMRPIDQDRVLSIGDGGIALYDLDNAEESLWETVDAGRDRWVRTGELSANGRWLVSTTRDGYIELWDTDVLEERSKRLLMVPIKWQQPTLVVTKPMP